MSGEPGASVSIEASFTLGSFPGYGEISTSPYAVHWTRRIANQSWRHNPHKHVKNAAARSFKLKNR